MVLGRKDLAKVPDMIIELIRSQRFDYSKKSQEYLQSSRFDNEDILNVVCCGYVMVLPCILPGRLSLEDFL